MDGWSGWEVVLSSFTPSDPRNKLKMKSSKRAVRSSCLDSCTRRNCTSDFQNGYVIIRISPLIDSCNNQKSLRCIIDYIILSTSAKLATSAELVISGFASH